MKFYKVFRVDDGELYSAFEGWYSGVGIVHYKVGEETTDPKLGKHCPGLMILLSKKKAIKFLMACPINHTYVLHEVDPKDVVTIPIKELAYRFSEHSYLSGHTDALLVGKLVKRNRRA